MVRGKSDDVTNKKVLIRQNKPHAEFGHAEVLVSAM